MTRPTRYKENESSRDWIDEFCATKSVDEVRGAFLFNMGKYQRRYGKKDEHLQEAMKIQDYANRLVEYERSLVKPVIHELYTGGCLIPRPEQEWIPSSGKEPDLPDGTLVDVKFSDGHVSSGRPTHHWEWTHDDGLVYITHYRIHQPE